MSKERIRLVYDSTQPKIENTPRPLQSELVHQLELFDEISEVKLLFVPVMDVSPHCFMKALEENDPLTVLDTRDFPDFFSIFLSTVDALHEFERRGINYNRLPVIASSSGDFLWESLGEVKSIILSYCENRDNASIFVLSSTRNKQKIISEKLIGYLSQELSKENIKIERILA